MARYIGPVCRLCRREGEKLYLKGERCFTPKCAIERRNYPPGQHGRELQFRRSRPSDYGLQLREKQKLRRIYGVLERQFRRYFEIAQRARGMTGALLLILLERRLDNVVYRLGFASSRAQARQLVRHGHFEVNGRKVDIPSYQVKPGDIIRVRESSREKEYFKALAERLEGHRPPPWLQLNPQDLSGQVLRLPVREEIDTRVQEHLIVEFYSR
ncbi:MAG TPA: 30S ribosomal protein S4 [Thermoflexus sp.]|jgi:small subunit ribosomal protein S4|uniref:Small ribosomal subunit protein uS4 n=1 Tax=Thermoflexus hugenholtzii JAD2 TaxID=877466 RepID=A0A212RH11_9CHLR|nr:MULTISPECIES: 30S ribosomal protein S4 [Thermoflexus]MDT7883551.1 30S ribosomal protein S4 [Thermoflexus sp.]MDT7947085.1 30S ribosomal protein S4 [Thermoflexus sp.]QWK10817.1 MAG: 30S ribosomal protein S4 [Thermoflexus hugenholtzii]SNB71659.1 SSU ribosomal protein S4P [Thermoflexus hugenholtzii JAD2]HXF70383.1 30S ribosomal protein S4 [Thermoflexus sp.]